MSDKSEVVALDGSVKPILVDQQLAILSHYVYTHQNTLPDSEIWKALDFIEHLARLGCLVQEMPVLHSLQRLSNRWAVMYFDADENVWRGKSGFTQKCNNPEEALRAALGEKEA